MTKRTKKVGVTGKYGTRYVPTPSGASILVVGELDEVSEVVYLQRDIFYDDRAFDEEAFFHLGSPANRSIRADMVPP